MPRGQQQCQGRHRQLDVVGPLELEEALCPQAQHQLQRIALPTCNSIIQPEQRDGGAVRACCACLVVAAS